MDPQLIPLPEEPPPSPPPPLPDAPPPLPDGPPPPLESGSSSSRPKYSTRSTRREPRPPPAASSGPPPPKRTREPSEPDEPEKDLLAKMMGFSSFDSTKGKKVPGNQVGAVHVVKKRRYRQYMNRKGGFNRPLDKVA